MLKQLAAILCLAAIFTPSAAAACETSDTAHPGSKCIVLPFKERKGVWFELKLADGMRKLQLEMPELRGQIRDYEKLTEARKYQIDTYREVITLQTNVVDGFKASQAHLVKEAREGREEAAEARSELHAWYRSPILWSGVGGVLVGAIAISIAVSGVGR